MTRLPPLLLIGLLPLSALAFDPRAIDIIAFRLGMSEAEVTATLARQGFLNASFRRQDTPCATGSSHRCIRVIDARTSDGSLRFHFSDTAEPIVERISYTFDGRKPNEPNALENAVVGRYGPPTTHAPMTWCDKPAGTGTCAPNAPRLVFEPGVGASRILTLTQR